MNTPFGERKTKKRRKKRRNDVRVQLQRARMRFEDFDLERPLQGVQKTFFLFSFSRLSVCLAHFFLPECLFFSSFSFISLFLSSATIKNVLLWGKGLRHGRKTKGHREEDQGNNNNNKGCVGTRVIATREKIRFLFFRRTVSRRSRYMPSFFLSLCCATN